MKIQHKPIALSLTLAICLSACQRSDRQENVKSHHDSAEISATASTESGNTVRWDMPEPMMKHMRNLEQDVQALESSTTKDHTVLATKIDEHTKQLISNCTMDGKSHDSLHDWLMPFLKLNKDYAAAPDVVTKSGKFKEIQDSLSAFHERFE